MDLSGNVIVSGTSNGRFNDQLTGTSWLGTIVKYDSFGNLQWVQQFGPDSAPPEQAVILSIITDIHGNIFTTGYTNGNILNGTDNSSGVQDAFITKHNSSGQIKWMQQIGIPNATISGNGLGLDSKGNLYVIGNTNRGINGTPIVGANDVFLIKYE
ncbi:beta-propeller repeat protein [Leptospira borgpetersenii serovar Pomona str. 200901868]|uniref:Beta-propeller repeat protein n=1 Tax=Leptospira borgpetersenii serovar Pomona str. 200901868 TaxID=1192866 RepID=M6VRW5_LEPBO|nr:beta-propeller repeat protein [Leptospira borgpetersenii serovar Pomona str. 200901868]